VTINATGSTTGTPRTIGINGWGAGNAARYTFGDPWNALQNAFGDRMQLTAYWGIEIFGNTGTASALPYASGAAGDASLNVLGTRTAAPVLIVTGAAGQTGNLQEWGNSAGTVLTYINSSGAINLNGSTSGTVTIQPQATAGTYNFNLPTDAGNSGDVLISGGGGANAMTWENPSTGFTGNSRGTIAGGLTRYSPITGTINPVAGETAAYTRNLVWRSGTIKKLYVEVSGNPGAFNNVITIMKNGVATGVTVTLNGVTTGSDLTNTSTVAAGDEIGVRIVTAGGANSVYWSWAVEFSY